MWSSTGGVALDDDDSSSLKKLLTEDVVEIRESISKPHVMPDRELSVELNESPIVRAVRRNRQSKLRQMRALIARDDLEVEEWRCLAASSYGLVSDEIRCHVWPILARNPPRPSLSPGESSSSLSEYDSALSTVSDSEELDNGDASSSWHESTTTVLVCHTSGHCGMRGLQSTGKDDVALETLKAHAEWNQVEMDVHRTLARFPPNIDDDERAILQSELTPLIIRVLRCNHKYRYYQGFHDVCLTLLLVLGVDSALTAAISLAHRGPFSRYLLLSLEDSAVAELALMYPLLAEVDAELETRLRRAELGCLFALSWPLTWFSHSIRTHQQIELVFDFLLASDPLMPVYLTTAIVLHRGDEIATCAPDMASLHHLLSNFPNDLPLAALIADAADLAAQYPPMLLQGVLCEKYRSRIRTVPARPTLRLPRHTLQMWLLAGTASAAAAFWILSRYSFPSLAGI